MPSIDAASSYAELRRQEAVSAKRLYAIDASYPATAPVTEVGELTDVASTAVNPSTRCTANMTAPPKVVQSCAANASGSMPCCNVAAK